MMMVNGGHGDVAIINSNENSKRIHTVSSSYQWMPLGNIKNNDSNDISPTTTKNERHNGVNTTALHQQQ